MGWESSTLNCVEALSVPSVDSAKNESKRYQNCSCVCLHFRSEFDLSAAKNFLPPEQASILGTNTFPTQKRSLALSQSQIPSAIFVNAPNDHKVDVSEATFRVPPVRRMSAFCASVRSISCPRRDFRSSGGCADVSNMKQPWHNPFIRTSYYPLGTQFHLTYPEDAATRRARVCFTPTSGSILVRGSLHISGKTIILSIIR